MSTSINGFGEIAESLRRSTVLINAGGRGNGSGVIWSSDGLIITNAHVAQRKQLRVQLWDSRELDATVIATDPVRDIASLRVRATNLPAATIGNSSRRASISGRSARLPSGNHFAWESMNERGMSHGPRCEPATNSSVEARLTGSTGIQKLAFWTPSTL